MSDLRQQNLIALNEWRATLVDGSDARRIRQQREAQAFERALHYHNAQQRAHRAFVRIGLVVCVFALGMVASLAI